MYPHAIALGIFLALAGIYFMPVLQGKVANQHDVSMWKGAYQEVGEFKKKTGETTMWSNAMFGGMPSYTYGGLESKANITPYIDGMMKLWLPSPMETIWLLMLCFYIFLISYGVSPWLGVLGAIAYGFSSYNFINLDNNKSYPRIKLTNFFCKSKKYKRICTILNKMKLLIYFRFILS